MFLDPGNVQIITTGSRIKESIARKRAVRFLELNGISCDLDPLIKVLAQEEEHPHFCLPHQERVGFLRAALTAENKQILWALRGGSGTSRLLPELLPMPKPKVEKTIIGFSDLTALHLFASQLWGWNPIHAPVVTSLADEKIDAASRDYVAKLFKQGEVSVTFPLEPLFLEAQGHIDVKRQGLGLGAQILSAPVTGGNLSLLSYSLATPWQVDARGKIIVLEEVGEPAYKIMELLDHLNHSGIFDEAVALLFGDLGTVQVHDEFMQDFLADFLKALSRRSKALVFQGAPYGHGLVNYPFQYNRLATLQTLQDKTIRFSQHLQVPLSKR